MLPSLKQAELNDIYIEGLLLEIDTNEIKQLNCIFKERCKNGEFEQFKLKLKEISIISESTSSGVNSNECSKIINVDEAKAKNSSRVEQLNTPSASTTPNANLSAKKKSQIKLVKKEKGESPSANKISNNGQ